MESAENKLLAAKLKKVLDRCSTSKKVSVLAEIDGQPAVIKLEKTAFSDSLEDIKDLISMAGSFKLSHHNDIYYKYQIDFLDGSLRKKTNEEGTSGIITADSNDEIQKPTSGPTVISTELICPASEKTILKNTGQALHIIEETPALYKSITLPWIETVPANEMAWLDNILEGKAEQENILLQTPDWILTKDYKQDAIGQKAGFHYITLFKDRSLRTIRDLKSSHIPMLRKVLQKGKECIAKELAIEPSEIRAYFHYLPTFFSLHAHFSAALDFGAGMLTERAHLLSSVINNLELVEDYYSKAILPLGLRQSDMARYSNK